MEEPLPQQGIIKIISEYILVCKIKEETLIIQLMNLYLMGSSRGEMGGLDPPEKSQVALGLL